MLLAFVFKAHHGGFASKRKGLVKLVNHNKDILLSKEMDLLSEAKHLFSKT